MKNIMALFGIWCVACSAMAVEQKVGVHYKFSDDSDRSEIHDYTVDYFRGDYGVGYSNIQYKGETYNFYGDRVGFLIEKPNFEADLGLLDYNGKTQFDGDMLYNNQFSDFLFYELGAEHSALDSELGLNAHLTATTLYASVDLYTPRYDAGLALVPAVTYFEDNGQRDQLRAKLYKGVGHGFHIYARTRHYTNSEPDNGFFFSPEDYEQILYGVGVRRYFLGGFFRGHIDYGHQKVNDFKEDSWTYRVAYKRDGSDYDFYAAFEESEFSKFYTYRYSEIGVYYKF